jgi:DNA-binding beta-propeller fold protein YncE
VTAYVSGDFGVTPIDTVTNRAGKAISATGAGPIAITPNGKTAYVVDQGVPVPRNTTDFRDGWVVPVRTATNTAGHPIPAGSDPSAIAITP